MNEGRGGAGEGETRESLASEKEMGIIVVKGNSFRKSLIQEYGKRATFASFVLQATNGLPTLYLVLMNLSDYLTLLKLRVFPPKLSLLRFEVKK